MATIKAEKYRDNDGVDYEFIPPLATETERGGALASLKDDNYTEEVKIGNDGKLYAKPSAGATFVVWEEEKNTVTYVVDTGITPHKEEVVCGTSCLSPSIEPKKDGYDFIGWRYDKTASSEIEEEVIMEDDPITLYAVFRRTLGVKFISYNNTKTKSDYQYYNNGKTTSVNIICPSGATYAGWDWRGWSNFAETTDNATVANADVKAKTDATISISDNYTMYGLYQKPVTVNYYKISNATKQKLTEYFYYNASGNTINPKFSITPSGFGSEWTWRGWTTIANDPDAEVSYSSISNKEFSSDITLYPLIYMLITLSYDGNGATSGSVSKDEGYRYLTTSDSGNTDQPAKIILKANGFTRTNYTFTGWSLGAVNSTVELYEDTTTTATWVDNGYYAIKNGKPQIATSNFTLYTGGILSGSGEETNYGYYGGWGHTNDDGVSWGIATGNLPTNGCKYLSLAPFAYLWGSYDIAVPLLQVYGNSTEIYNGYPTTDVSAITGQFNAQGTNGWSKTWDVSAYSTVRVVFIAYENVGESPDYFADVGIINMRLHN